MKNINHNNLIILHIQNSRLNVHKKLYFTLKKLKFSIIAVQNSNLNYQY